MEYELCFSEPALERLALTEGGELLDERRLLFRWSAMSLGIGTNASGQHTFLFVMVEADKGSISGQIASQMVLSAVGNAATALSETQSVSSEPLNAVTVVKESLRLANKDVYDYAHRLGRGGQLAATGQMCSYDGENFAVGRVGNYENYLWRANELIRLHEGQQQEAPNMEAGMLRRFIGANAQVLVDLSALKLESGDTIVMSNSPWREDFDAQARMILRESASLKSTAENLALLAAELSLVPRGELSYALPAGAAFALLHIK